MERLTSNEEMIFNYIKEAINERGYSPSVRDIQISLGIKSTSTAQLYIEKLEKKGYIRKENGRSRSIRITVPSAMGDLVPLVGRVTAGMPILAEENFEGYIRFAAETVHCKQDDLFALRVTGQSMIEAGILDGDIVIVKKESYSDNGRIVVALIEDEATVKTFYKEDGHYRLQPENKTMDPIIVDEVALLGIVVASFRQYE